VTTVKTSRSIMENLSRMFTCTERARKLIQHRDWTYSVPAIIPNRWGYLHGYPILNEDLIFIETTTSSFGQLFTTIPTQFMTSMEESFMQRPVEAYVRRDYQKIDLGSLCLDYRSILSLQYLITITLLKQQDKIQKS
jgi:hypothetical protein